MSQVRVPLRLALVALAVALAVPAAARRHHATTPRPRIVNGVFTTQYATVGALLRGATASSASLYCSGTLIGCQTFLTAGHCVCNGTGPACQPGGPQAPNPAQYFVYLPNGGVFPVASIAVRTDFSFPVGDVAVLHLATPVTGIVPTPIATTAPGFGTAATIVGFGRQGNGVYDYGLDRAGAVSTSSCAAAAVSDATSVCWIYDTLVGPAGTDADTCNGDSGGPLFVGGACGVAVAGVTSGGTTSECTPTDASYDANVATYASWIQSQAGADLGATACGDMPQVGDPATSVTPVVGTVSLATPDDTRSFEVPAGTTELRLAMNAVDDGSDFDLYVRAGAPPTTAVADCSRTGSNQYAVCTFTSPTPGTWYALVHRYAGSGTYQLTATVFGTGGPGGGGGGNCDDGDPCTVNDACQGGTCVGTPAPDGTPCDDGLGCTAGDVCGAGVCGGTPTPLPGCHQPGTGRAAIDLRNDLLPSRDKLDWRWARGSATMAELGDPTTTTSYEMCLFDTSAGVPKLRLDVVIPPSGSWTAMKNGFRYHDAGAQRAGLRDVRLRAGDTGGATIMLRAKGATLPTPPLPFQQSPEVTLQLSSGAGCWEADYGTHSRNDGVQFRARSN